MALIFVQLFKWGWISILRHLILRTEGCILLHGGKLMEVPVFSFDDAEEDFSTLLQKYYENYTLYYYY